MWAIIGGCFVIAHTPGPWIATKHNGEWNIAAPSDPYLFGNTPYYPYCSYNDADWLLIAAAPDLLAFVHQAIASMDREGDTSHVDDELYETAKALVSKCKSYDQETR